MRGKTRPGIHGALLCLIFAAAGPIRRAFFSLRDSQRRQGVRSLGLRLLQRLFLLPLLTLGLPQRTLRVVALRLGLLQRAKFLGFVNQSQLPALYSAADVMVRVAFGIKQAIETIREHCEPQGPIVVEAHFDEFNLDVKITYHGEPLELPEQRPSERAIMETDAGYRQLAGFLLRRNADRVRTSTKDGASVLEFHFEH